MTASVALIPLPYDQNPQKKDEIAMKSMGCTTPPRPTASYSAPRFRKTALALILFGLFSHAHAQLVPTEFSNDDRMNYEEVQKEVDGVELPVESWSSENKTIYNIFTGTNSGSSVVNNIEFSATDQNLSTLQGIRIDNNKAIQFEQNAWVNLTSKNAGSTIGVFSNYGSLTVDKSLFVDIDASRTSQGNYAAAIYGIAVIVKMSFQDPLSPLGEKNAVSCRPS